MNKTWPTSGPWENREANDGGHSRNIIATDWKGDWVVANVNLCMGKESEANARLISKAPELLDILVRLLSGLTDSQGVPYDQDLEDRIVEANNIIKDIEG
jgi:hypothetical protein